MRVIVVHGKGEDEAAAPVHAFVGFDSQGEIEYVVRIREGRLHRLSQRQLAQVCKGLVRQMTPVVTDVVTFLHSQLRCCDLFLLLRWTLCRLILLLLRLDAPNL